MRLRERLSAFARRKPWAKTAMLRLLPNFKRIIQVPAIGPFCIRSREHRCYWLRHPLVHDRLFLGGIQNLVTPGMVIWDVGGHIGLYCRIFAQKMDASRVVVFEPDPRNRELLSENLRLGRIEDRVTLLPYALCDKDGMQEFLTEGDSSQRGRLAQVATMAPGEVWQTLKLESRSVDSLVSSGDCPPPDLLKLDVEGAEASVLRGAREVLAVHSPRLAIELHDLALRPPVFDELELVGYKSFGYCRRQWRELTREDFTNPLSPYDLRHIFAAKDVELLKKPAMPVEF